MRLDVRRAARAGGFPGWDHAAQESWKEKIFPVSACQVDGGSGNFTWDEARLAHRLDARWKRGFKRMMYGLGVWP